MTPFQADNWRQFSARMAFAVYRNRTASRRARLVKEVDAMIDCFLSNYPITSPWGGGTLGDVDCWDGSEMRAGEKWEDYCQRAAYPCDSFDSYVWDRGYIRETKHGEERGEFGSTAMCCIRAGFDIAVKPSAGVLGFDMGDMRAMFPEGFPPYVAAYLSELSNGEGEAVDVSSLSDHVRIWL